MIRLIKMELYRLIHTVSAYVGMIVMAGIVVLTLFAMGVDLRMMEKEQKTSGADQIRQEAAENDSDGMEFTFGITSPTDESWLSGDIVVGDLLMSELNSCLLFVIIAIFVPLFVNAEQKKGYIKNIAGQIPERWMLALSKLPAVAVQVLALYIVFCISHLAAGAIFFRGRLIFEYSGALAGALGMQYVLHVAWGCLIAMITMAARSTAFAMTTGILLASGLFQLAAGYLNRAVHALIPSAKSFDILQIALTNAASSMTTESTVKQIMGFLVLAVGYVLISAVISGIIYHKRDVR